MAIQVVNLKRSFKYKGKTLEDIPGITIKEVVKAYSGTYPELINSNATFKGIENDTEIWDLDGKAGLKG